MSSIKTSFTILAVTLAFSLSGCGDANNKAVFSPESGHPSNWQTGHKTAGKTNLESCFECHGEELDGGISKVSCTQCHLGSSENIHPLQWGSYAYARHSRYVLENGTTSCANAACHGVDLLGVVNSGPSCATCHIGGTLSKHPAAWGPVNGNYDLTLHGRFADANGLSSCRSIVCHGADLKGVFLSGPACTDCHN